MIHLQICQGTTCYVMGAAQLAGLATQLPEDLRGRVRVTGCHCLGLCREGAFGGAPYVTIDGEVLARATVDTVLTALRQRLRDLSAGQARPDGLAPSGAPLESERLCACSLTPA
jgi:NADH:ubiquinone oxidoreductase subunit E